MCDQFGLDVVNAYMRHVQDNAEEAVRKVIGKLHDGCFVYALDNGAHIRVDIKVNHTARRATIDYTGTSPQLDNKLNAPDSIPVADVLYFVCRLVYDYLPINAVCLTTLEINMEYDT